MALPLVAVDGVSVDGDSVVDAIVRHERVGNICTLTIERWPTKVDPMPGSEN